MTRTKLTAHWTHRLPESWTHERPNPRQRAKQTYPYKIKLTLSEQQHVDMKKNGNVIKTNNVMPRSKYFNDRSDRLF